MSKIKVSIVLPVFNAERYLDETLKSIGAQSFRDYELIAVDDGSIDSSVSILRKYIDKINNMTIITNENAGVSKTRNHGINIARGEYICFVDSDDILHEDYLKKLYAAVKKYNADITYCNYFPFYNKVEFRKNEETVIKQVAEEDGIDSFDYAMEQGLGTSPCNKLYKLDLLKKYEIKFNENSSYGEDMFFNWKVFLPSKKVYYVEEQLYGYRQNISGTTMKYHPNLYDCYIKEYNLILQFGRLYNFDCTKLKKSIMINLLKRLNSIFRMNVRRKDGIKNAYDYIRYILNENQIKEAMNLYEVLDKSVFNKMDQKIINLMLNNKTVCILILSYYIDYKFRLVRVLKTILKK